MLGVYYPGQAYPGRAPDYSGLVVVSLDHACERRMASDTPIRTTEMLTGPRTVARVTPVRSMACLED